MAGTPRAPSGDGQEGPGRRAPGRVTNRRDLLRIGTGLALGAALSRAFAACAQEQDGPRAAPAPSR